MNIEQSLLKRSFKEKTQTQMRAWIVIADVKPFRNTEGGLVSLKKFRDFRENFILCLEIALEREVGAVRCRRENPFLSFGLNKICRRRSCKRRDTFSIERND